MEKDIFIDTNVAKNFSNPMDFEYIKLIVWLMQLPDHKVDIFFNKKLSDKQKKELQSLIVKNKPNLVYSKKIHSEYNRASSESISQTAIPIIINKLITENRLNSFTNSEIKQFNNDYSKQYRKLTCNKSDKLHVPIIMMSNRKKALIIDNNFRNDVNNFPGFKAKAESKPRENFYK